MVTSGVKSVSNTPEGIPEGCVILVCKLPRGFVFSLFYIFI